MLRTLAVAFLAVNALFWGLFPHSKHCAFIGMLGVSMKDCPSHTFHITLGVVLFLVSVLVAQWSHFTEHKN